MTIARFDMRLDEKVKAKAEKANTLLGMRSLSEYMSELLDRDATEVIARHESITVENNRFDQFMTGCEKADRPNAALIDAAEISKESGIQ